MGGLLIAKKALQIVLFNYLFEKITRATKKRKKAIPIHRHKSPVSSVKNIFDAKTRADFIPQELTNWNSDSIIRKFIAQPNFIAA